MIQYNEDFNKTFSFLKYGLESMTDVCQNKLFSINMFSFDRNITDFNEKKNSNKIPLGRGILGK
jgi:hypothetical protein